MKSEAIRVFCLLAVLLAAFLLWGFDRVGSLCVALAPTLVCWNALRQGQFAHGFGCGHSLIRASDPEGFWLFFSAVTLLAALAWFYFMDELLRGS